MANRRFGGVGGNRPGASGRPFSHQQSGFQSNVSPWQQGQNNNNDGIINQFSNSQQLAVALSSLLQSQQSGNHPPSLLSLNSGPGGFSGPDNRGLANRGRPDIRRFEPYSKGRLGGGGPIGAWRAQSNGNRNPGGFRRGPPGGGSGGRDRRPPQQRQPEKQRVAKGGDNNDSKNDESTETKRDWKDEKKSDEKREDGESKEGKYVGVPQHLLHCFVCSKDMWDGESFQKHIKGKAHKQMLDSLEESFHIVVNILRENMRLIEEKKLIELSRIHRLNKKYKGKFNEVESHCNMCDFKFLGKIMAHRKTEGHQRLKRFLHPNCTHCSKEFHSRMDWVDHRLTPEHLQALATHLEKSQDESGGHDIIKSENVELDLEPLLDEATEAEEENPVLEITDDLLNLQNRVPAYRKNRPIASKSLQPFIGFYCEICLKSFVTEELSQMHLKSVKHYHKFVEVVKNKYQKRLDEEKAKAKEAKKEADESADASASKDVEMYDPEEASKDENDEEQAEEVEEEEEVQDEEEQVEEEEENEEEVQEVEPVKEEKPAKQNGIQNKDETPVVEKKEPAAATPVRSNKRAASSSPNVAAKTVAAAPAAAIKPSNPVATKTAAKAAAPAKPAAAVPAKPVAVAPARPAPVTRTVAPRPILKKLKK